jgi:hypothetical protein
MDAANALYRVENREVFDDGSASASPRVDDEANLIAPRRM